MLQFNRKSQRYLRGNKNKRQENAEGGENKGTIKEKWAKLKKTVLDEMVKEKVKGKRKSVEYKNSWDKQRKYIKELRALIKKKKRKKKEKRIKELTRRQTECIKRKRK